MIFIAISVGFPRSGRWGELFNSDVCDNWVNPLVVGNNGAIYASGGPLHNLPFSAAITIPPRAILCLWHQLECNTRNQS